MNRYRHIFILLAFMMLISEGSAQRGIGLNFGTDLNHFFRAKELQVVDGWFSTGVFGPYYQAYFKGGGYRLGLNVNYKNGDNKGFPNFPVVMNDFADGQNVGVTAIELDLKVGPRWYFLNPQIGYIIGYQFQQQGFLEPNSDAKLNPWYVQVPFGCSFDWPTGYGSVGFGIYYEVGLTNVMRKGGSIIDPEAQGSKLRALHFSINTVFMSGKQERKKPPPPVPIE